MVNFRKIHLGYEEYLLITSNGQIHHVEGVNARKVRVVIEKRKRGAKEWYYQRFWIKGKCHYLHRIVATAWVENPLDYDVVKHIDGNTLNNSANNLAWCFNSQEVKRHHHLLETDVFYQSLNPEKLTGQSLWIWKYYHHNDEIAIRGLFQTKKLRHVCGWYSYVKVGDDRFETIYDQTYEEILTKIKQGFLRARYGSRHDNCIFNYAVRTFSWLQHGHKQKYMSLLAETY